MSETAASAVSAITAFIIATLQERYVIRGGREGFERLKLLHRVLWPATCALFDLLDVRPGMRCADLGCGGGEVTLELARLVGADGHVTGFDRDEVKLELARANSEEQGFANVDFSAADVNEWSGSGEYDLVYCRMLLQHLSRPVDLLGRMWAAVGPDGILAVEDADFDGLFCDPPNEGFAFFARTYPLVLARYGGDSTAGRKLYRYFLDAGLPPPQLRLAQPVGTEGDSKLLVVSTLEATAGPIVAEGIASQAEVDAAIESFTAFAEDPTTLLGNPRIFQCWSRRAVG